MNLRSSVRAIAVVALCLSAASVRAEDELVEKVVVRNRLHNMAGKLEAAPSVGFMLLSQLTDHITFTGAGAYNVSDTFGVELRAGYAYSRHTGLARQVSEHLLQRNPAQEVKVTSDLANLWQMGGYGLVGARWSPIYGKISLMAELPVHFQAYLWVGGGAGSFSRESVVYCQQVVSRADGKCTSEDDAGNVSESFWKQESKVGPVAGAALGFRFFTHQKGAIKVELRNYAFPDSYLEEIDRLVAEKGGETGTPVASPGFTNLVLIDAGYTFIF